MNLTSKLPNVTTSIFTVMSQMASEHQALNLSQGFPNFESDPELIRLVSEAMQQGYNQYAPMPGDNGLRQVIADKVVSLYGARYDAADEITITAGATQAIFTAIAALVKPGDEVIIFTPAYDCYEPAIELNGAKTVAVQLEAPHYRPDWDLVADRISSKTRMIIINSPHNPSGMLWEESDMKQLEQFALKHQLWVLSDEVYEHIIFDGQAHQSACKFPGLKERSFITASFGKTFHNTGWKMGYVLAPKELMVEFRKVHQYNVFSVNHPMQKALASYMQDAAVYQSLGSFYQQKRDMFLELISPSRFRFLPSKGTYFQLLDFSDISEESDITFAERLTREHKIATIPTSVFNEQQRDFKQLRVCFAKTEATLREAAEIFNNI